MALKARISSSLVLLPNTDLFTRILLCHPAVHVHPHLLSHRMCSVHSVRKFPSEFLCLVNWVTGAAEDLAHSSLRFGIGRFTTEAEIDFVVDHIVGTVKKLRDMRFVVETAPWFCDLCTHILSVAHCGRWSKRVLISTRSTGRSLNTSTMSEIANAMYNLFF
jgi:hypothetical protein